MLNPKIIEALNNDMGVFNWDKGTNKSIHWSYNITIHYSGLQAIILS